MKVCDGEKKINKFKKKTQILKQRKNKAFSKGPSIFIWLTGESECVTGSDEKCI